MEALSKSHFSLQMGNCPIPAAEHSGLCHNQKSFEWLTVGWARNWWKIKAYVHCKYFIWNQNNDHKRHNFPETGKVTTAKKVLYRTFNLHRCNLKNSRMLFTSVLLKREYRKVPGSVYFFLRIAVFSLEVRKDGILNLLLSAIL